MFNLATKFDCMTQQIGKKSPRKYRPSYFTSILMISLVLLILGMVGMIGIHFQELSKLIKENVRISLYLPESMNEVAIIQLQKKLETEPFVKYAEYISKEQAKEEFLSLSDEEEDFEELLGSNPLPASINLYLRSNYATTDSIEMIKNKINTSYGLESTQMKVNEELVTSINSNLGIVSIILGGLSIILFIITIILIDSTVRLSMYSNRFLVKSMQLVGADRWFITRPYMTRSIANGFISGVIAVAALVAIFYFLQKKIPGLEQLQNLFMWSILFVILIGLGMLISWWSTLRAVTKYLKTKLDELY